MSLPGLGMKAYRGGLRFWVGADENVSNSLCVFFLSMSERGGERGLTDLAWKEGRGTRVRDMKMRSPSGG